jgi:hypothetical protein
VYLASWAGVTALELVPAVVAIIAAGSLAVAWRASRQTKQLSDRGLLPVLVPVLNDAGHGPSLRVANTSTALAVEVGWAVLRGDRKAGGGLREGDLEPGKSATIESVMSSRSQHGSPTAQPIAIACCRSGDKILVWSTDGRRWTLNAKRLAGEEPVDILGDLIGEGAEAAKDVTAEGISRLRF